MECLLQGHEHWWSIPCQHATPSPHLCLLSVIPWKHRLLIPTLPIAAPPTPGWGSFNGIKTFHKTYSPILTPEERSSQILEDVSNWKEESRFSFPMWRQERRENLMVDPEDVAHGRFWMQPDSSLTNAFLLPASSLRVNSPLDQRKAVGLTWETRWFSGEMSQGDNTARTKKPNSLCQIDFPKDISLISFSIP